MKVFSTERARRKGSNVPGRVKGLLVMTSLALVVYCSAILSATSVSFAQDASAESVESVTTDSTPSDSVIAESAIADTASISAATTDSHGKTKHTGLFATRKWNAFLLIFLFSAAIVFYTSRAKGGAKLFIRKIPGLEAVEEAVGRATEMGRTVLFIPGIQELDDIQTIAGLSILGRISKITAEYDTPLMVPVRYPLVFAGAQETVKQSYAEVGRSDAYQQDTVRYVAGEQFAFAANVNGWMMRAKPAANIYMGAFFAESLLLAENGFASGAIQIAGTAEPAQLPFFIAACDYTLIGEELYAASAYLSHEPLLLGGLKGQDLFKALLIVLILAGVIGVLFFPDSVGAGLLNLLEGKYS